MIYFILHVQQVLSQLVSPAYTKSHESTRARGLVKIIAQILKCFPRSHNALPINGSNQSAFTASTYSIHFDYVQENDDVILIKRKTFVSSSMYRIRYCAPALVR